MIDPGETHEQQAALEAALAAARGGDAAAFQRLVWPHLRAMHALARRVVGDAQLAEDVVQEALVGAWQGVGALQHAVALRAWLFQVVARRALDRVRQPAWRRRAGALDQVELPAALGPSPADDAVGRELADRLEEALERLPARQRTALHLRAREGLDYAAIAAVLRCSASAARMLVLEARRRVRERLGAHLEP
ncbi:MAG: sigma-70 family RNA polymerase sigma factor [Planctomycetes bacterium]|nr:sigma-70 family RNA polymerase sigma factor [Planctomycetota bacterium]